MKTIKNTLNAATRPKQYERNNGVSQTIPDQTMSVRELLERYARGLPISGAKQPVYHGEEYVPDLNRMDLAEIQELKDNTKTRIDELKSKATQEAAEAKAKKYPKKTASPEGGREGDKNQNSGSAGQPPAGTGSAS